MIRIGAIAYVTDDIAASARVMNMKLSAALSAAQHTVAWWLRTDTLPEQYKKAIYGPLM